MLGQMTGLVLSVQCLHMMQSAKMQSTPQALCLSSSVICAIPWSSCLLLHSPFLNTVTHPYAVQVSLAYWVQIPNLADASAMEGKHASISMARKCLKPLSQYPVLRHWDLLDSRIKEACMLLQVAVALAGLSHQASQLCQRQLVILVCVCRLKQL